MSARIRKSGDHCDKCSATPDSLPGPHKVSWLVEVIDPDTHTVLCQKHFEQTMKHWRKADALVKALQGGDE